MISFLHLLRQVLFTHYPECFSASSARDLFCGKSVNSFICLLLSFVSNYCHFRFSYSNNEILMSSGACGEQFHRYFIFPPSLWPRVTGVSLSQLRFMEKCRGHPHTITHGSGCRSGGLALDEAGMYRLRTIQFSKNL